MRVNKQNHKKKILMIFLVGKTFSYIKKYLVDKSLWKRKNLSKNTFLKWKGLGEGVEGNWKWSKEKKINFWRRAWG